MDSPFGDIVSPWSKIITSFSFDQIINKFSVLKIPRGCPFENVPAPWAGKSIPSYSIGNQQISSF